MDTCRICLSEAPENNIQQLKTSKKDGQKDYLEIMLFCLDIHITEESLNITKKLCSKCFKKVLIFYKFKTLALDNDAYFKSLAQETVVKEEVEQSDGQEEMFYGERHYTSENHESAFMIEFDDEAASNHDLDAMNEPVEIETEELCLDEHNWDLSKNIHTKDTVKEELDASSETSKPLKRQSLRKQNISAKTTKIVKVAQTSKKSDIQNKPVSVIKNKVQIINESKLASGPGACHICGANVSNLRAHSQTHMPKEERRKYPCEYCDKAYTDPSSLRRHRNATHLGILHHCDICNTDVPDLRTHRQYKHDRDAWSEKCSVCNIACISKSALDIHMARHTGEKNYQCEICSKQFSQKGSLKLHIDSAHIKKKHYFCSNCNKGFYRKTELRAHVQTHSEWRPRPWKCSECGKHLATKRSLQVHKQLHEPAVKIEFDDEEDSNNDLDTMNDPFEIETEKLGLDEHNCRLSKDFDSKDTVNEELDSSSETSKPLKRHSLRKQNISAKTAKIEKVAQKSKQSDIIKNKVQIINKSKVASGPGACHICGANVSNLRAHSQTHMPKEERRKYPCEYCDKAYTDPSSLRRHRNATHLGILHHCDICNTDVPDLRTHRQYKHDRDAWSEKCSVCNIACISKSALDIHMARHTGEKNYQCEICSKQFSQKGSLKLHIDSAHIKKKHYFCSNCNKGFYRKTELRAHVQTHSEWRPRPWQCSECGKHLATKRSLQVHNQLHSDIKYPCKLCRQLFAQKSYLAVHMRAHRKEKPYECKYCDAKYARSFDRNKHLLKQHPHQIDATALRHKRT